MKPLAGTFTVLITPFTPDGTRIAEDKLRWLVDYQINGGIQGLIVLASNGEFLSMTDEERHDAARIVIEQSAGRVPVVVGTAAENTDDVIRYSRDAESLGADAVMILTPYYAWIDEDELFHHYKRVGEAISIPIMLYNHPASTTLDIPPPLVARLAEIDTISYMKESTTDVRRVHQIHTLCGDKMTVFGGYLGYESYAVGAKGWVCVCSNIIPEPCGRLYRQMVEQKDWDAAWKTFHEVQPIIEFLGDHLYVHGMKAAFKMMGIDMGDPRPPRLPLRQEHVPELKRVMTDLGLFGENKPVFPG